MLFKIMNNKRKTSLIKKQKELEKEGITRGIKRYRDYLNTITAHGAASYAKPGERLICNLIEPLSEAIKIEQNNCRAAHGRRGRPKKYCDSLLELPPDELSLITLRQTFNACADVATSKVINVAIQIANLIEMEINRERLKIKVPKKRIERQKFLYKIKKAITKKPLSREYKVPLGTKLISLLIKSTSAFEHKFIYEKKKKYGVIRLSDKTRKSIEKQHEIYEYLRPYYLPMICPPVPWKNLYNGGYITAETKTPLIKGLNKNHIKYLIKTDLRRVYKALNLIQNTPWRINRDIYKAMRECFDSSIAFPPKVIPAKNISYAKKPQDYKTNKEARKEWHRKKYEIDEKKEEYKIKRIQLKQKLSLAQEYFKKDKIYFPHNMDWRGRIYPIPAYLNPQGDDASRALLEFAKGKPLGEHGVFWLKIHLANLYGKDKCSFEERIDWVNKHEQDIKDSAKYPIKGKKLWKRADKPWRFLAACLEWQNYQKRGIKWTSHIPIAMDGTCNGLQHYSALGHDLKGGKATNLIGSEKPQDIYIEVLDVVKRGVEDDKKNGVAEAHNWSRHLNRKIVKQGVMTTPYGVTEEGLKYQLKEILKSENIKIHGVRKDNVNYLAKKIIFAVGKIVKSAPKYMLWFRKVAKLLAENNIPIKWTTPVGFVVYQAYKKTKRKEIKTILQSIILREEISNLLDIGRQKRGLPPNFIHSQDAAHMMMTIIKAYEKYGISSYAMVHDSYGVHACDWDNFGPLIRISFVEIYSKDVLDKFRDEIQRLAPTLEIPLPPSLPSKIDQLDIRHVLKSRYFFS